MRRSTYNDVAMLEWVTLEEWSFLKPPSFACAMLAHQHHAKPMHPAVTLLL